MTDFQQPAAAAPPEEPSGFKGIFNDPSTLAATGFILAVLCSVTAGLVNFLSDPGGGDFRARLMLLTDTVDIGDVAVLGLAIALMVLTPDPPGGVPRPLLMQTVSLLAGVAGVFGLVRSLVLLSAEGDVASRLANFVTTMGVAVAAATVAFYAARESLITEREEAAANAST